MRILKSYKEVALVLVVIGAVNWGLVGVLDLNLVNVVFGSMALVEKVVYILVGLAGLAVAWEKWGQGKK